MQYWEDSSLLAQRTSELSSSTISRSTTLLKDVDSEGWPLQPNEDFGKLADAVSGSETWRPCAKPAREIAESQILQGIT